MSGFMDLRNIGIYALDVPSQRGGLLMGKMKLELSV